MKEKVNKCKGEKIMHSGLILKFALLYTTSFIFLGLYNSYSSKLSNVYDFEAWKRFSLIFTNLRDSFYLLEGCVLWLR